MITKTYVHTQLFSLYLVASLLAGLGLSRLPAASATATQVDVHGPAGSGQFGYQVLALPNGNIVVTDPHYSTGSSANVGAVYLYNGHTRVPISVLTGSQPGDQVGLLPVTLLNSGDYVVDSPQWANGAAAAAGAVTWCSGTLGCTGVVSATNSLVGSHASDQVGIRAIMALNNGNYVVSSPRWANGAAAQAGAVTWCSGTLGCAGAVSATNSLVGSHSSDQVGIRAIMALNNGNYVVSDPNWYNGAAAQAGAVTWCSGTLGCTGAVTTSNSLVGSQANDLVGAFGITLLSNGNYVVRNPGWHNGPQPFAGAVTWCSGTLGCTGAVTTTNSLVGSDTNDGVGSGITALSNGNYVVSSPIWHIDATPFTGAITWGNGSTGITGVVTLTNSLVGGQADENLGTYPITVLNNGNYVVSDPAWNNDAAPMAGAATWCSGTLGCIGVITTTNSLVGTYGSDQVGLVITPLNNGNFVVGSPLWTTGVTIYVGAATWCSGTLGCTGAVTTTNSLVGSQSNDEVGGLITAVSDDNYVVGSPNWANGAAVHAGAATWCGAALGCTGVVTTTNSLVGSQAYDTVGLVITALGNGNYVVGSPYWANNAAAQAGAATWCSGTLGCTGAVTTTNSLAGSQGGDQVGNLGIGQLSNDNYMVLSSRWANGAAAQAGAVTWANGASGVTGVVTTSNSLVGSHTNDQVGYNAGVSGVTPLSSGRYVVVSPKWANGGAAAAGAVTWAAGATGLAGLVTTTNSVLGGAAGGGNSLNFAYDGQNDQLVVGRPAENLITFFGSNLVFYINVPLVER